MRILLISFLLLGGCSMLQPQPLPAPEPIIKTITEYKTLEIYQPYIKAYRACKNEVF
jgi:hypothetical protein